MEPADEGCHPQQPDFVFHGPSLPSVMCQRLTRVALISRSLFFFAAAAATVSNCAADELSHAVRSAVTQVSPSVVRVQIVGAPDRAGNIASRVTTGVVVSTDGEIVSSSFGFGSDIAAIFIQGADGERHGAVVAAIDQVRKLVLLRAKTSKYAPPKWADSVPDVGAWAVATGRFYATSMPSAALGVVSAVDRVHGLAIQTDAKVSPINYGGPLVGLNGSVFGVLVPLAPGNEATGVAAGVEWYDSGIGFAVPAKDVLESVERLRTGEDRRHGVLGISLSSDNQLSPYIEVKTVHSGSPADLGGIQVGDQIMTVNGRSVARIGTLQRILKSSWAGDLVSFGVRRGSDELQIETTLTDEIKVPDSGWLGIVPLAAVVTDDNKCQGVSVGVLTGSSAAIAGLPNPCVVSRVDDVAITSLQQLRGALKDIRVRKALKLTFFSPDRPIEHQTVRVVAGVRTIGEAADLVSEVAAIRALATAEATLPEWTQSVSDLGEEKYAWVFGPRQRLPGVELGIVIVLHDGEPVTDTLLQDWKDLCQRHHLVLAVLYHEYAIPLESVDAVPLVMARIARMGTIDPDRVAVVTRQSHAEFVTRLLLSPRFRRLRQAVFISCRPSIAGVSLATVPDKELSLLLFPSGGDTQAQVLLTSAVTALRNAGATVLVHHSSDDIGGNVRAGEIARWMLLQKIR